MPLLTWIIGVLSGFESHCHAISVNQRVLRPVWSWAQARISGPQAELDPTGIPPRYASMVS